jgi:hypothetical protein
MDRLSVELVKCGKINVEEELYSIITKILCMSTFFKMNQPEKEFNGFLNSLRQRFFNPQTIQMSPLLSELQATFERDFTNESTKEQNIVQQIRRLKNFKDFLHKRISLSE